MAEKRWTLGEQPYFHVAFQVRDFDAAKAELTRILNIEWEVRAPRYVKVKRASDSPEPTDGAEPTRHRAVFSVNGPPFIQLLETPDLPKGVAFRFAHLGYFDSDLPKAVAWMEDLGLRRERSVLASDGEFDLFALFHSPATGLDLEVVNPAQSVHS